MPYIYGNGWCLIKLEMEFVHGGLALLWFDDEMMSRKDLRNPRKEMHILVKVPKRFDQRKRGKTCIFEGDGLCRSNRQPLLETRKWHFALGSAGRTVDPAKEHCAQIALCNARRFTGDETETLLFDIFCREILEQL